MVIAKVNFLLERRTSYGSYLWLAGGLLIASLVALPVAVVCVLGLFPTENIWPHLIQTVLLEYVFTTTKLMLGVAVGVIVIGVGTAWLVSTTVFPFKYLFHWALMLPLAMPTYIVAYVYTDLLEFAGPVQGFIRETLNLPQESSKWFPEIRSIGGAILIMSFTLYPYVYLLARVAFFGQFSVGTEVSRTLGSNPWRSFALVSLPLARPAIAIGVALALMETLNDFGTVDYFAVPTLTAGIYNVWLTMGNVGGGAQIALVALGFVVLLILLEKIHRRQRRYYPLTKTNRSFQQQPLSKAWGWLACCACFIPIIIGFVIPSVVLARYAVKFAEETWSPRFFEFALNSLFLAIGSGFFCVVLATFLAYAVRLRGGFVLRTAAQISSLGYAIPGAVIAIGVLIPFGAFDNAIDTWMRNTIGVSTGLILSGTVLALFFAYIARFFALSYGPLDAGLGQIKPSLEMAARTLGKGPGETFRFVHLPLMRGSLLTALLLVFVDVMKELPATLLLRPFNFETLATYVYQYGSSEQLEHSALGALAIVLVGLFPVILLSRAMLNPSSGLFKSG